MKIVKTHDWYDPEGLNIPDNRADLIWEGPYEECLERLKNIRSSKITQFSDRKDISVGPIQPRMKVVNQRPAPGGGYYITKRELDHSEYFEIYYMSAISKEYYSIVE